MNIIETKQTELMITFNYAKRPVQINNELKETIEETIEENVVAEEFDFKAYFNNLAIA